MRIPGFLLIPLARPRASLALAIALMLLAGIGITFTRDGDEPARSIVADDTPTPFPSTDESVTPTPSPSATMTSPAAPGTTRVLGTRRSTVRLPIRGDQAPTRPAKPAAKSKPVSLTPVDFIKQRGSLSRASMSSLATESMTVTMHDGIELYVEVTRPDPAEHGDGPWPVIMEISPYHGTLHGRTGTRIFPDARDANGQQIGLTGYFPPRGYAVVMVDLRGTGKSQGCLDHLGPDDAKDIKMIVEWAAEQPWSNGRVGVAGHSYVGSTPSLAAAVKPKGLATIVPSAGLATMYDHQFQYGVPYFLQWAGPIEAYEELAINRHLPPFLGDGYGDNSGNDMEYFGCGLPNSAITAGEGQITGQYQAWHAARDWRADASAADIPVFMVHGVNDNAARIPAAEWFFGDRPGRSTDKVWLGQWDHGSNTHVNQRYDQWMFALHAWFDKHLKQLDMDTGPPVEVFLNGLTVMTMDRWGAVGERVTLHADAADTSLSTTEPAGPGSAAFVGSGFVNSVAFDGPIVERDTVIVGLPKLTVHASVTTSQVLHLVGTIYATDGGSYRPMGYCTIQPGLRNGVETMTPVIPGEIMVLEPQCFTLAHRLFPGERIQLRFNTDSPHHVIWAPADARITIYTGPGMTQLEIPVVEQPRSFSDFKLRLGG